MIYCNVSKINNWVLLNIPDRGLVNYPIYYSDSYDARDICSISNISTSIQVDTVSSIEYWSVCWIVSTVEGCLNIPLNLGYTYHRIIVPQLFFGLNIDLLFAIFALTAFIFLWRKKVIKKKNKYKKETDIQLRSLEGNQEKSVKASRVVPADNDIQIINAISPLKTAIDVAKGFININTHTDVSEKGD